ncbi:MAG: MMPL family transporter, partial [Candidatus Binatia bacterium]
MEGVLEINTAATPPLAGGFLRAYAELVVRRPKWTLALVVLLIAFAAAEMRHLRLGMRLTDMVPEDHPHTRLFARIAELFGVEKTIVVGLRARDGDLFTAPALAKVVATARALEQLPGVVPGSVLSLADPRVKTARTVDGSLETTPLLAAVPTEPAALADLRRRALASTLYRDLVVSADGSATTLIADFRDSVPDTEIHERLRALAESIADANTEVVTGGAPVLGSHLQAYSARVAFVLPLTFLVVALVHYEAFRTIQAMVLPLVTALASVVLALGVMGALGFPIDPWNATTPVVILAVAAGHAVQMLKRYYEELGRTGDNRRAVVEAMVAVGPVMLAAGGIAAAGFLSLATFGVRSVRVFGLLLAFGVAAALVVEMTLVPACRALLPP